MEYKTYLINKLEQTTAEYDLFNKNKTYVVGVLSLVMTITSQSLNDIESVLLIIITLIYLMGSMQIGIPITFVDSKELFDDESKLIDHVNKTVDSISEAHNKFELYTLLYIVMAILIISINYIEIIQ